MRIANNLFDGFARAVARGASWFFKPAPPAATTVAVGDLRRSISEHKRIAWAELEKHVAEIARKKLMAEFAGYSNAHRPAVILRRPEIPGGALDISSGAYNMSYPSEEFNKLLAHMAQQLDQMKTTFASEDAGVDPAAETKTAPPRVCVACATPCADAKAASCGQCGCPFPVEISPMALGPKDEETVEAPYPARVVSQAELEELMESTEFARFGSVLTTRPVPPGTVGLWRGQAIVQASPRPTMNNGPLSLNGASATSLSTVTDGPVLAYVRGEITGEQYRQMIEGQWL